MAVRLTVGIELSADFTVPRAYHEPLFQALNGITLPPISKGKPPRARTDTRFHGQQERQGQGPRQQRHRLEQEGALRISHRRGVRGGSGAGRLGGEEPARRQGPAHRHLHPGQGRRRSEEHTSELQSRPHLVCRLLLGKKKLSSSSCDPLHSTMTLTPTWPSMP